MWNRYAHARAAHVRGFVTNAERRVSAYGKRDAIEVAGQALRGEAGLAFVRRRSRGPRRSQRGKSVPGATRTDLFYARFYWR